MKDGMSAVTAAAVSRAVSCRGLDRRTHTAPAGGRLGWVDIARALAMLAVIFGHVGTESVGAGYTHDGAYGLITMIINPVKLPVFFALSGYLHSHRYDDCEQLAHRTLRARLIPYVFWGSFMGLVATAMDLMRCGFDFGRLPSLLLSNYILPLLRGNLDMVYPMPYCARAYLCTIAAALSETYAAACYAHRPMHRSRLYCLLARRNNAVEIRYRADKHAVYDARISASPAVRPYEKQRRCVENGKKCRLRRKCGE